MDEFKEERAAMKNGTPKEKLTYFFDYYKWHVIVGVIAVIFAVTLIHQVATRKDTAFYALMLNVSAYNYMDDSENANAFAEYAGKAKTGLQDYKSDKRNYRKNIIQRKKTTIKIKHYV